jgi:UDP-3-O-[3-hydroxymyristoyl] glucosamine N-acyltransferase
MSEPVFYHRSPGLAVKEIVELTGARLSVPAADQRIFDVAAVERAGPHDITLVDRVDPGKWLRLTQAGACFVRAEVAGAVGSKTTALVVDDPYRAFVQVAAALYPDAARPSSLFEIQGRAPSAFVHPGARVEAGVTIDPAAVVAPGAEIGSGTVIGPMVVIGPQVRIGRDCSIEAGASMTNALIGDRVSVGPGCRIGLAGAMRRSIADATPALGRAILQDKVSVGSNAVVERGINRDTIIGEGTMVDPLVHVPADAVLGRYCRIRAADGSQRPDPAGGEAALDGVLLIASQLNCADLSYSRG